MGDSDGKDFDPVRLWWRTRDLRTKIYRKIAGTLLNTNIAVHSHVTSEEKDVHSFSSSMLGVLAPEAQIMVFEFVANEGVATFLRLGTVCKWTRYLTRSLMHATLQEEACRLACYNISLSPVSSPVSYVGQFTSEMRSSLMLRLLTRAFTMMTLHCASPHCALSMRAYNQALVKDRTDSKQFPQLRNRAKAVFFNTLESTGVIRVAFHRSELLAAAHDAPVAYVSTHAGLTTPLMHDMIVRVDAGNRNTIWSPHSEMAVSEIVPVHGPVHGPEDSLARVCWMSASHDGSALLYAVSEYNSERDRVSVRSYLWDMESQTSHPIRFVTMVGSDGLPVEPCFHGWESLYGWFRKDGKAPADASGLDFAVVFQHDRVEAHDIGPPIAAVMHSIWHYRFCRSTMAMTCQRVGLEASDALQSNDRMSSVSNDVSGRWMACRVIRGLRHHTFACLIDVDRCDDADAGVIFCCPKAFMGGRFVVRKVAVSPAGDKLAMLCNADHSVCVEVHKRISDTACIRLAHIPIDRSDGYMGGDDPSLCILTFSPCSRFLVWKVSEVCRHELQALMSVALPEDTVGEKTGIPIAKLNTVRSNMPRDLCWRGCGVWMRLRRGAVLMQS